jgi:Rrf2 family transcriptional regulator, nitric oxide-sensitive transcriptional repressor
LSGKNATKIADCKRTGSSTLAAPVRLDNRRRIRDTFSSSPNSAAASGREPKVEQLSTVDEIAKTYGISRRHITKVVHHLGHRGYLCNVRGKRGRIALGREPSAINIGTLVREREDNLGLVECYRQRGCCLEAACVLRKALDEALLAFLSVLSRYTLADLLKPDRRLKSLLQIPILASRSAH